jgi:hypothetical protein
MSTFNLIVITLCSWAHNFMYNSSEVFKDPALILMFDESNRKNIWDKNVAKPISFKFSSMCKFTKTAKMKH